MLELKFAKEPFDFKLFILCFLKKIWIVLMAMLVGAILAGGCNYIAKVVMAGPVKYEVVTTYYVDYYFDRETGMFHSYYNDATWKSMVKTDWFVDATWENALESGFVPEKYNVKKEDMPEMLSASLETDLRMPFSCVATSDPELTVILNDALQQTFLELITQQEVLEVRVIDETVVREQERDDRTFRACILGAVLGAFFAAVGISFRIIMDDSVRLPETFTYRYGIPALGILGKGEKELSKETLANIRYRFREKKNVAMLAVDEQEAVPECMMPEEYHVVKSNAREARYEDLRQAEGVLLWIRAGMRNSKEIEHLLHELAVQDVEVQGVLLYDADTKLLKAYRIGRKQK